MRATIGELEKLTGMSRTTLRYYDTEGRLDPERQETDTGFIPKKT